MINRKELENLGFVLVPGFPMLGLSKCKKYRIFKLNKGQIILQDWDKNERKAKFNRFVETVEDIQFVINQNVKSDKIGGIPRKIIKEYAESTKGNIPEFGIQEWLANELIKIREEFNNV